MSQFELTKEERQQYQRHIMMSEFGEEGQLKLKAARVLVMGAGGLGCPVLQYLAAAGVGKIGIVDYDKVEKSNLQRQILFNHKDIGQSKALTAKASLEALNPYVEVVAHPVFLNKDNIFEIIAGYDIIADGTDNFPTRYLINDACVLQDKLLVHAAIFKMEGQVAIFNAPQPDGSRSTNYRDVHLEQPAEGTIPSCSEAGVLGVLPGIIGSIQANEIIKWITGMGQPLVNKILTLDTLSMRQFIFKIKKNKNNHIKILGNYGSSCAIEEVQIMGLSEWEALKNQNKPYQRIDVRSPEEFATANSGGINIPLNEIIARKTEIEGEKVILTICKSGQRSRKAAAILKNELGIPNVWSLELNQD